MKINRLLIGQPSLPHRNIRLILVLLLLLLTSGLDSEAADASVTNAPSLVSEQQRPYTPPTGSGVRTVRTVAPASSLLLNSVPPPSAYEVANAANGSLDQSRKADKAAELQAKIKAMQSAPSAIEVALKKSIAQMESTLADPALDVGARTAHERAMKLQREQLEFHQKNSELWKNYAAAKISKDEAKSQAAESELSDFLRGHLTQVKGKEYPSNMKLERIMEEYRTIPGVKSTPSPVRRRIIIAGVGCLLLIPIIVISVKRLQLNRRAH